MARTVRELPLVQRVASAVARRTLPVYRSTLREMDDEQGLGVYMHPVEWSQIVALLEACAPARVLEWGSGGSTRAILQRGTYVEAMMSIENDAAWRERVAARVKDPRLVLEHVAPNVRPPPQSDPEAYWEWCRLGERSREIMADYVDRPSRAGRRFDFVLVDGRARRFCLEAGWDLLDPGGLLVLHDAQREDYRGAFDRFGRAVYLEPWDGGQVAFARKPRRA